MSKITVKLPNPEGVVAGGIATFRIPVGRRIHGLILSYAYDAADQKLSHFTEIRLFINGAVFQRYSATERDMLNRLDRLPASAGVLEIPFDRRLMKTAAGEENSAINTGVADETGARISSMYMEIDIAGGTVITSSDLSLHAVESDVVGGGAGSIPYIRREQRSVAGADSDFQISDLINPGVNAPDKIALTRATFSASAGTISRLRVDRNNYNVFDRTEALNTAVLNGGARTRVAGYFTIDTGERGRADDVLDLHGMTDFRYRLNVSAAATITCLSEYMGVLTN